MARRRFFVPEVRRGFASLTGGDAEHLVRVLRVEPGQLFEISDNTKVYEAVVDTARKSEVTFRVEREIPAQISGPQVTLFAALIKFDRFELMVEKATELGVAAIQPFAAVRSERGLLQAAGKRVERWRRIALEASQQSRRARLPVIFDAAPSLEKLEVTQRTPLFLDEEERGVQIASLGPFQDAVALVIGPEGGWTDDERTLARDREWRSCGLGQTILRAETAAMAALVLARQGS